MIRDEIQKIEKVNRYDLEDREYERYIEWTNRLRDKTKIAVEELAKRVMKEYPMLVFMKLCLPDVNDIENVYERKEFSHKKRIYALIAKETLSKKNKINNARIFKENHLVNGMEEENNGIDKINELLSSCAILIQKNGDISDYANGITSIYPCFSDEGVQKFTSHCTNFALLSVSGKISQWELDELSLKIITSMEPG